jgi:hypothetical protein
MNKNLILKWWLFFSVTCLGVVGLFLSDIIYKINDADVTKISFLIGILFIGCSVRIGKHIAWFGKRKHFTQEMFDDLCGKQEDGWFAADMFFTLGMIGTVLGFIYMLSTAFAQINVSQVESLQEALTNMSMGMGTALYTTASGLICSMLLKLQLYFFQKEIDKTSKRCGCETKL